MQLENFLKFSSVLLLDATILFTPTVARNKPHFIYGQSRILTRVPVMFGRTHGAFKRIQCEYKFNYFFLPLFCVKWTTSGFIQRPSNQSSSITIAQLMRDGVDGGGFQKRMSKTPRVRRSIFSFGDGRKGYSSEMV